MRANITFTDGCYVALAQALDAPLLTAERHRSALAFVDALMTRPGDLDDDTVAALRLVYTTDQLVELALKVLKFNTQKLQVTLGTHRWITADEIAAVRWNQDGDYVVAN